MPPASLFDFQVNGFAGVDFQRDGLTRAQFDHAIAALRRHRTAGLFVTLITDDVDALAWRFAAFEQLCAASPAAAAWMAAFRASTWVCSVMSEMSSVISPIS